VLESAVDVACTSLDHMLIHSNSHSFVQMCKKSCQATFYPKMITNLNLICCFLLLCNLLL